MELYTKQRYTFSMNKKLVTFLHPDDEMSDKYTNCNFTSAILWICLHRLFPFERIVGSVGSVQLVLAMINLSQSALHHLSPCALLFGPRLLFVACPDGVYF